MPYISKDAKLQGTKHDKRVKLNDLQRKEIFDKYETGSYSQRQLAREYGVSRRLITFIIDPKKKAENLLRRKESGGSKQYYKREKHTKAIKTHRRYKEKLFKENLIHLKKEEE